MSTIHLVKYIKLVAIHFSRVVVGNENRAVGGHNDQHNEETDLCSASVCGCEIKLPSVLFGSVNILFIAVALYPPPYIHV